MGSDMRLRFPRFEGSDAKDVDIIAPGNGIGGIFDAIWFATGVVAVEVCEGGVVGGVI
jgi:hypothetical protein